MPHVACIAQVSVLPIAALFPDVQQAKQPLQQRLQQPQCKAAGACDMTLKQQMQGTRCKSPTQTVHTQHHNICTSATNKLHALVAPQQANRGNMCDAHVPGSMMPITRAVPAPSNQCTSKVRTKCEPTGPSAGRIQFKTEHHTKQLPGTWWHAHHIHSAAVISCHQDPQQQRGRGRSTRCVRDLILHVLQVVLSASCALHSMHMINYIHMKGHPHQPLTKPSSVHDKYCHVCKY
jgi:hypothetical protein